MLRLLVLLVVFGRVKCDINLSTSALAMEVGNVKSFQLEINDASINSTSITVLLTTLQNGVIDVEPKSIRVNFNGTAREFTYDIKLKAVRAGKSTVFATIASLTPNVGGNEELFLLVKIYKIEALEWASFILGWFYFLAWSMSFYPQIYTNYRRKSVVGLSFDFILFNIYGYVMYTAFNVGMFFVPVIKEQYANRHPRSPAPVNPNDLVFSVHSLFVTLVTITQCLLYEKGSQKISMKAGIIMLNYLTATAAFLTFAATHIILWLDVLYLFSYTKLFVTVTKYTPQVYLNYKRKTTQGWSIGGVTLDLVGGILSIFQMAANGYNYGDWTIVVENPTKFGLGLLSIVFSSIFVSQHCLYKDTSAQIDLGKKQLQTELPDMALGVGKFSAKDEKPAETAVQEETRTKAAAHRENKGIILEVIVVENSGQKHKLSAIPEELESDLDGVPENPAIPSEPRQNAVQTELNEGIMLKLVKVTKVEEKPKEDNPKQIATEEELFDEIMLEMAKVTENQP